tara:strand:+ start:115 stop:345 length:231 start_codon:yes stop_codon:yes gene_type:complete
VWLVARCSRAGDATFKSVYRYLKSRAADAFAVDYDSRMRGDLLGLMGQEKLRLWPLVDQLIFVEECDPASANPNQW